MAALAPASNAVADPCRNLCASPIHVEIDQVAGNGP